MHLTLHVVQFAPSSLTIYLSNLFSISSLQVLSLCLDNALALPLLLVLPVVQLHYCKSLTLLLSRPLSLKPAIPFVFLSLLYIHPFTSQTPAPTHALDSLAAFLDIRRLPASLPLHISFLDYFSTHSQPSDSTKTRSITHPL